MSIQFSTKLSLRRIPLFIFLHDSLMVVIALWAAYWLRFNLSNLPTDALQSVIYVLPIFLCAQIFAGLSCGLFRGMWSYFSMADVKRIVKSVVMSTVLSLAIIFFISHISILPRTVPFIYIVLLTNLLILSRLSYRLFKERHSVERKKRVMIIGAGNAGEGLVRDILRNPSCSFSPVLFLDDKLSKVGQEIHGIKIKGPLAKCQRLVEEHQIDLVIIAVPSASRQTMRHIMSALEHVDVPIRILPSLEALANGLVTLNSVRSVSLEDLLGRKTRQLDLNLVRQTISNKVVMVTGGGGSIGSELCLQIAELQPTKLVIVDNCEFNLYKIEQQLMQLFPQVDYYWLLESITDEETMFKIMRQFRPNLVFHAAAYKHVPLLESQVQVAIRNNIIGTSIVAKACADNGIEKCIMISTDKAVNSTNVMGASKRLAELICLQMNQHTDTRFIIVRFGNVLGSSGSVVPLFKQQIANRQNVTVTHPEVTRYFMTIPEAGQLILQASSFGKGGEVFVLDMGEPIKIKELAENLIKLSGLRLNEDIKIDYTGLRPGEKLHEELFYATEKMINTDNDKIFLATNASMLDADFLTNLQTTVLAFCHGEQQDDEELKKNLLDLARDKC